MNLHYFPGLFDSGAFYCENRLVYLKVCVKHQGGVYFLVKMNEI